MQGHDTRNVVNDASFVLALLTLAFAGLKLVGLLDWSWWGVCVPILLPFAAAVLLALYFVFIAVFVIVLSAFGAAIERIFK